MRLVFATGNAGKLREAREILAPAGVEVLSPADAGLSPEDVEVEETGTTFRENSLIKARHIYSLCGLPCFADDSGLVVDALNGEPGIYSARYASLDGGEDHNFGSNIAKLLYKLQGVSDRTARFVCAVTLIIDGEPRFFDGTCEGRIAEAPSGGGGFGYDPVFLADAFPGMTLAEVPEDDKNAVSHRGVALKKMESYLRTSDSTASERMLREHSVCEDR